MTKVLKKIFDRAGGFISAPSRLRSIERGAEFDKKRESVIKARKQRSIKQKIKKHKKVYA